MKEAAIKEIKDTSVKIAIDSVEKLMQNSLDKTKLDKIYNESIASPCCNHISICQSAST